MRRERNSNRGFTLTEMLVAFAVLAIALSGIAGLLNLASKYYSNSRREVEVQNQLQATFTQVGNMIIDANIDVRFDGTTHRATIINSADYYAVELQNGNLYIMLGEYSEGVVSESDKINEAVSATVPKQSQNILADHVETFLMDTSGKDDGYVVLAVRITYENRSAYLSQNLYLRNFGYEEPSTPGGGGTVPTPTPTAAPSGGGAPGGGGTPGGGATPIPTTPPVTTAPTPTVAPGGGAPGGGGGALPGGQQLTWFPPAHQDHGSGKMTLRVTHQGGGIGAIPAGTTIVFPLGCDGITGFDKIDPSGSGCTIVSCTLSGNVFTVVVTLTDEFSVGETLTLGTVNQFEGPVNYIGGCNAYTQ